jgi:putative tryptophan/tyrosine transport system substrate-binding protein
MRRRAFIALLGGAAAQALLFSPAAARGQQAETPVIGFLNAASAEASAPVVAAFRHALSEAGYEPDKNVTIEYRWANDQHDRLPALASELVRRRVSVIVTGGNLNAALAAKAATSKIPIVFLTESDPVKDGLVANLNRPRGNLTGITTNAESAPKRFEVLREVVPATSVMAMLVNPINNPASIRSDMRQAQAAAHSLGLQIVHVLQARPERDLDGAFSAATQRRAGGLVISADAFFSGTSKELADLATRHAVPAISPYREFVKSGGLMSYGDSLTDAYRLLGDYTGRILKGEKPAELPVQQATKAELAINRNAAKALGLDVPPTLLSRADEVID